MKRKQIAEGKIYIEVNFKDDFPEEWDDETIEEYIMKRINDYVEVNADDYEIESVSVLSSEIDNYGGDDEYGI